MSDKLKKFVTDHKEEFDTREPSKDLWKKIDEDMGGKKENWIKSKQLSKYLYVGFGLSILIIGLYFLNGSDLNTNTPSEKVNNDTPAQVADNENNSSADQNNAIVADRSNRLKIKERGESSNMTPNSVDTGGVNADQKRIIPEAENENETTEITGTEAATKEMTPAEKKRNELIKNRKNKNLYIPPDPEKFNLYVGTIYEGSSFCSLLGAFKLYGDVQIDHGKWHQDGHKDKVTIRAVSCSYLANTPDMKAVWLKGKTDQKLKFAISKGFKNVILIKKDGSRSVARAISHYYPGIGAIGEFEGKFFNLVFTEKVELILFFKNAEDGDKIMIDDKIEAIVKSQP